MQDKGMCLINVIQALRKGIKIRWPQVLKSVTTKLLWHNAWKLPWTLVYTRGYFPFALTAIDINHKLAIVTSNVHLVPQFPVAS